MISLSDEQVKEIKNLHQAILEGLNSCIDGASDIDTPKEITNPLASCLISEAIDNQIHLLNIINEAEEK